MVLENDVVFGSVNANRGTTRRPPTALADADQGWLARLITRACRWRAGSEAFEPRADDVKVVLDFAA